MCQDHLERGGLNLKTLKFRVLDEADEMLNMGFVDDVETILSAYTNPGAQTPSPDPHWSIREIVIVCFSFLPHSVRYFFIHPLLFYLRLWGEGKGGGYRGGVGTSCIFVPFYQIGR